MTVQKSGPLAGKVALVTGGGNGIGRATVMALRNHGAKVAWTDILDSAPPGDSGQFAIRADATLEPDAARTVEETLSTFGRLDIAVHNVGNFGAGDRWDAPLEDTALEAWNATVCQCLTSCMLGMKYAIPALRRSGGGAIVNIASLAGIRVTRFASPAYAAAKAGVVHLSQHAAVTLAPENVRVNVVAPGLTLTPNIESSMPPATRAAIAAEFQPMNRMMTTQEIAEAILWAASPASSGVTGLVIPVDGGWAAK
ncbi:SDR family oxidoreductase [Novosphingobium sp. ERN07]|nr:SDR family oxidoreductase [Novosphingobium sp. ERN07]